jgi:aminoglycoside phosphotransferase (APT) family kinase protein
VKTCNTEYENLLPRILGPHLGGGVLVLRAIPTYYDTIVYEGGGLVFKALDPNGRDRDGIAVEAWACERARQAGVPAPEVLELDTSRERFPSSFFVMRKAAGRSLEEPDLADWELKTVLERLGGHLAALHEIALPGFGWLIENAGIRGEHDTWANALLGDVPASIDYLAGRDLLSRAEIERVWAALETSNEWSDGRLLHGDLELLHTWVDPSTLRITSLVDFGDRRSGDPAYDFIHFDPRYLDAVLRGYDGNDSLLPRIAYYRLAHAVPWAAKWHSRGEPTVIYFLKSLLRDG